MAFKSIRDDVNCDSTVIRMNLASPVFSAIAIISVAGSVIGSWAPFQFQEADLTVVWQTFAQNGFSGRISRSDVVVNFWLGFPLAIGLCGLFCAHSGSLARRFSVSLLVLLAQLVLSLVVELGQGWILNRVPSFLDFALQLAGAVVATAIWHCAGRWIESKSELISVSSAKTAANRLDAVLTLTAAGVLAWTVMPMDVIVSPAELVKESLKTEFIPFTRWESSVSENLYQWFASILLAVPLGLWFSRFLAERFSGRLSLVSVLLLAIVVGVIPEACQFPIDSRVASATDALFGAFGALAGLLIGSRFGATRFQVAKTGFWGILRTPGFWLAVAIIQALVICAVAWMPFDFSQDTSEVAERLKRFSDNPLSGYRGSDLLRLLTLFRQLMLAAVLGAFLGIAYQCLNLNRLYSIVVGTLFILLMLMFSIGVELGQLIVDSRTGEAIGIVIRSAGSIMGLIAALTLWKQAVMVD